MRRFLLKWFAFTNSIGNINLTFVFCQGAMLLGWCTAFAVLFGQSIVS